MFAEVYPVMTKGSFATFYGGDPVIREIEQMNKDNSPPSPVIPLFLIISSLFQMSIYLYKRIKSSTYNNIHSYIHHLKNSIGIRKKK